MKKVLITGAGGFIGGFIVEEALRRGYETWAAVRATTALTFLTDERIHLIEFDFNDPESLESTISEHVKEHGKWDYVVHNLGATKCANFSDFNRINCEYVKLLTEVLIGCDAVPEVFLLMSSLSVMGVGDEEGYTSFTSRSIPMPNTRYGVSKLMAESHLRQIPNFPYTIFRCTGVYGPHERDYFLMMKSIKQGFDFSVGFKKQMLTFIYVKDLARGVFESLEHGPLRKAYYMSEDRGYTQSEFRKIVADALGKRFVLPIKCPLWVLWIVCAVAQWWGTTTCKPSTLNRDKYKIIKQRNWLCDTSDAERDFGFKTQYPLEKGVKEAIDWYKSVGWL